MFCQKKNLKIGLRKCSAWHFVKGAEEQFLSSLILCQKAARQMTARGLASVKHDGSEQRFTKTPPCCLSTRHIFTSMQTLNC